MFTEVPAIKSFLFEFFVCFFNSIILSVGIIMGLVLIGCYVGILSLS
jgi:hypothetical protein